MSSTAAGIRRYWDPFGEVLKSLRDTLCKKIEEELVEAHYKAAFKDKYPDLLSTIRDSHPNEYAELNYTGSEAVRELTSGFEDYIRKDFSVPDIITSALASLEMIHLRQMTRDDLVQQILNSMDPKDPERQAIQAQADEVLDGLSRT